MLIPSFITNPLRKAALALEDAEVEPIEKIGENLTPNMRALRLAMTIAEQLLSMGVAASDVVHMSIGITRIYCARRVHIDVSSTMITVSQDRGNDHEPLTLVRTINPKDANYQTIQRLQSLALEIRDKQLPLEVAEQRVDKVLSKLVRHSPWVVCLAGGTVSAGVVLLYDGTPLVVWLSFLMGFAVTATLRWMGQIGLSTFYSQIIVSFLITLAATGMTQLSHTYNLGINPTLFVIGGIVLLVAGMMIVGAFQDAIDEFYVTANARLLKVAMATGGIVVGVLGGLYIATKVGVSFPATPDRLTLADTQLQYVGAMLIAAAFALKNHARLWGTLVAGGVGVFGWWISRLLLSLDIGVVISTGIAAAVIGLMATFVSRFWKIPSMAIIASGVVPLVPGLSLYNGLMGMVAHPPGDGEFMFALATLTRAIMIGLAVAAGATLGNMVGRPLRRRAIRLYNRLPRRRLSQKSQKKTD